MKYKLLIFMGVMLLIITRMAFSQSTAIMEIVPNGEGTLIAVWIATPTERVITTTPLPTQTAWIITATPRETTTPTTTNTPTITNTPNIEDTPTPETTPPVPTFTYTPVPTKVCSLRANGFNIRIRTGPGTGFATSSRSPWEAGTESVFVRFQEDAVYLWGEHQLGGWSAVAQKSPFTWWVDGTQDSIFCFDVTGWPGWVPPEPIAAQLDGAHILVGASEVVLNWIEDFSTLKGLTHSHQIPLLAKQINPDIVIVYRSLHNANGQIDGPTEMEWYNPYIYWQKLKPWLTPGFDYYEFINEWGGPPRSVIADFNIAMLDLMGRDGYCGLAFSDGPGNPEIPGWDEYVRVLRWIDDHPCGTWPDGRIKYHGIALHQSGKFPDSVKTLPGNYSKNPWIYARIEIVRDYLLANHKYNLETFKGPVYITEMGWEDYTNPNEHFSCEQVKAGLDATRELYLETGIIDGFHTWNFGPPNAYWVDLTHCLPVMYPLPTAMGVTRG